MKAMILAAGMGTRLQPHSFALAKPAFPLFGVPLIQFTLVRLKEAGVTEAIINLHHLPDTVVKAATRYDHGIKLYFTWESRILGTAGGLKNAERYFEGCKTLVMLNSDILTNADINGGAAFHQHNKALATMLLFQGIGHQRFPQIGVGDQGQITFFVDKSYGDTGTIARSGSFTGIHFFKEDIFRFIPPKQPTEINRHTYPSILREGQEVFGAFHPGYWNDIGTIEEFLRTNLDILNGTLPWKTLDPTGALEPQGAFIKKDARLPGGGLVKAPSFIGKGTLVGSDAVIGPHAVLGPHCIIGRKCHIESSVVLDDTMVPEGTHFEKQLVSSANIPRSM